MKEIKSKINKKIKNNNIVLIDFYASWCKDCTVMDKILKSIDNKYNKINMFKVDVDNNKELAKEYNIEFLPTIILFNKNNEVTRFLEITSKEDIIKSIEKIL
jgi:thioredoxin 1